MSFHFKSGVKVHSKVSDVTARINDGAVYAQSVKSMTVQGWSSDYKKLRFVTIQLPKVITHPENLV
jgi:hypothetical protein